MFNKNAFITEYQKMYISPQNLMFILHIHCKKLKT